MASSVIERLALVEPQGKTPAILRPHVPQYLRDLGALLQESPTASLLNELARGAEEAKILRKRMDSLREQISPNLPQRLPELQRRRFSSGRNPEPLPQTLGPAVGRFTRAIFAVVGLRFPRPDLAQADREIAELSSTLPKHQELQTLLKRDGRLSAKIGEGQEELLLSFDQWAVQEIHRALIYLVEEPERLEKIIKAYQERVSKNPLPNEAIWYTAWVLSNARHLYNSGGHPEIFKKWFARQFPDIPINKITQVYNLFLPAILFLSTKEWSLLTPLNLKPDIIDQAHQKDLVVFLQWAFLTTAKRLGVLTSPEEETPSPQVCPPPKHKRHEKPLPPAVHPVARAETRPLLPTIVIQPVGTDGKFTLTPGEEISDKDLTSAIRDIFNLKEGDPKISFFLISIKYAQRVFWQDLRAKTDRIQNPDLQKRFGADWKIRRGDWQIVFKKGSVNGTPTTTITWIGTHREFERGH